MANKIRAMFVFEMVGKPPEHLKETLENHVKNLETDDIKIISKKIHEPKLLESDKVEIKDLYITFAEVELEISNLNLLFGTVFSMLPSHVEILKPNDLVLKNFDLSAIITDLASRIHKYDEIAKILAMERDNFARKLNYISDALNKSIKVEEIKDKASSTSLERIGSDKSESVAEDSKLLDDNIKKRKNKKKENGDVKIEKKEENKKE